MIGSTAEVGRGQAVDRTLSKEDVDRGKDTDEEKLKRGSWKGRRGGGTVTGRIKVSLLTEERVQFGLTEGFGRLSGL